MTISVGNQVFPLTGERVQLAYVVHDLDSTIQYWADTFNIGPFVVIEKAVAGRKVIHRGKVSTMEMSLAFSYIGDIQIELVQPTDNEPSPFREFLDSGQQGVHHHGFWPEDFEGACAKVESAGFRELCAIYLKDGERNVVYYEPPAQIGGIVELVPMTPARMAYFNRMKRLANNWDGARPIRRYVDREAFLASGEGAE